MGIDQIILIVVAMGFAVITGANDGSSLLSPGIPFAAMRTIWAVVILTVAVMAGPFLSTRVATTFTRDLVSFGSGNATALMSVAIVGAMIVVAVLTALGLPTSLGFAVVGGIVGTGLGAGLGVDWTTVIVMLAVGAVAPVAGGLLGYLVALLLRLLPLSTHMGRLIRVMHRCAYVLLAISYSFSGGQKMLAVFAIAAGIGVSSAVTPEPLLILGMGVFFALGTVLGLPSVSSKLSFGLYAVRPPHTIAAETAASLAAFGGSLLGAPISMTQGITGGLVGAGLGTGGARVRWSVASRMVLAWVVTLPACIAVSGLGSLALRMWT